MAFAVAGPVSGLPARIASLNLCTDQILLSLADPADILSLSPLATDCAESVLCERARNFRHLRPEDETLWVLKPTALVGGDYAPPFIAALANNLHIPFYRLPEANRLEDIAGSIRQMADFLGYAERGAILGRAFMNRLSSFHPLPTEQPLSAVIWGDETSPLLEDMLLRLNFRLVHLPKATMVEAVLRNRPDLLVVSVLGEGLSLKENSGFLPLIEQVLGPDHIVILPARLTLCGTIHMLDAMILLQQTQIHLARAQQNRKLQKGRAGL